MTINNELTHYFQTLEANNQFSGVVLITQGDATLFAGAGHQHCAAFNALRGGMGAGVEIYELIAEK